MLARLKSEFAYARGLLAGVSRTQPVSAAPTKTVGDYFEEWARRHGDRPALGLRHSGYLLMASAAGLDTLVLGDNDRQTVGIHELEPGDVQIDPGDTAA